MLGVAPLPDRDRDLLVRWRAHQAVELAGEARPVELLGIGFLDPPYRAALHKQALDRVERSELMVTCLQRPHFVGDAEQLADKVFEMRGQIDEKVRLGLALQRARLPACCHKPVM